jgi:hypothetical protein
MDDPITLAGKLELIASGPGFTGSMAATDAQSLREAAKVLRELAPAPTPTQQTQQTERPPPPEPPLPTRRILPNVPPELFPPDGEDAA